MGGRVCRELGGRDTALEAPRIHPPSASYPSYPAPWDAMHRGGVPTYHMPPVGSVGSSSRMQVETSMPSMARAPPAHWGHAAAHQADPKRVLLVQADGFPEVRVYSQPASSPEWFVGTIPSNTVVDFLERERHNLPFRKVHHERLMGWVAAKHVGHYPAQAADRDGRHLQPTPTRVREQGRSRDFGDVSQPSYRDRRARAPEPAASASPPSPGLTCGLPLPWSSRDAAPAAPVLKFSSPDAGALPRVAGTYDWIRKANAEPDREMRRSGAEQTLAVCEAEGYCLDGRQIQLTCIKDMCERTQILKSAPLPSRSGYLSAGGTNWYHYPPGGLLDVACERAAKKLPVVVINAASAYHAGGGFQTGGRHALEESICMRSSIFKSLCVAESLAKSQRCTPSPHCRPPVKASGMPWSCHIPETGCIISPNVEVFRGATDVGYPFLKDVVRLPIISVAMPNQNRQVRDAPVDAPGDLQMYRDLVLKKFDTMLSAAHGVLGRPGVLVIPDLGCGAYGNDPKEVGQLLGEAMRKHRSGFLEVHLVGQASFARAAEAMAQV